MTLDSRDRGIASLSDYWSFALRFKYPRQGSGAVSARDAETFDRFLPGGFTERQRRVPGLGKGPSVGVVRSPVGFRAGA
jgi:hypothetical protein